MLTQMCDIIKAHQTEGSVYFTLSIVFKKKKNDKGGPLTDSGTNMQAPGLCPADEAGLHGVCPPVSGPRAAASVTV